MVVIEDEPTATTGGAPETTLPDPAITSQSSPQRSPQRKHMVYFLLLGARGCSFPLLTSDHWFVCAGAEQLHREGAFSGKGGASGKGGVSGKGHR